MKKPLAFFIFFAIKFCVAQSKTNFEFGFRYRPAPIHIKQYSNYWVSDKQFYLSADAHLSGFSLVTGFEQNINKRLFLIYQLASRYADKLAKYRDSYGINEQIKGFLFDHTFTINYTIIKNPKMNFAIGLGTSICNTNSNIVYTTQEPIIGLPGVFVLQTQQNNLNFETTDFPLTFKLPNIKLTLVTSLVSGSTYWQAPSKGFVLLNLIGTYSINIPKKKSNQKE